MAGKKIAKMGHTGRQGVQRRHYCPECPEQDGKLTLMSPVMLMPGRRMQFRCNGGHEVPKGQTILQ